MRQRASERSERVSRAHRHRAGGSRARVRAYRSSVRGRVLTVLAVAGAVAGITAFGVLTTGDGGPQPRAATGTPTQAKTASPDPRGPMMQRSVPVELRVHAIRLRSHLLQLGLEPDGTVQIPPMAKASVAGWYTFSPTPGERGPSILIGRTDSNALGPGVFGRLGELRRGDRIRVVRADGSVAIFRVDRVGRYPNDRFPAGQVYGDIDYAGLRLITYGSSTSEGSANVIVYGSLVATRPAD